MKTLKLAYIDNSLENEGIGSLFEIKPRETGENLRSEFIHYEGKPGVLLSKLREINPDLILLDHFLATKPQPDGLAKFGSSFVEVIKESFPLPPIVGISGAIDKISSGQAKLYDDIFSNNSLSDFSKQITSLGYEFKKIRLHPKKTVQQLIKSMNPPAEDFERIAGVLSESMDDFGGDIKISDPPIGFNRDGLMWIYTNLMKEPGLLLDSQWAGAIFGLTMDGFLRFQKKFSKAKYTGPFSTGFDSRWWKSKLIEIGIQLSKEKNISDLGRLGAKFPGVRQVDLAKCRVCKKINTQTLGLSDESTRAIYVNLHLIHSKIMKESKFKFFEPMRIRTKD
ncbi:MAG TPA: hypothetical protein VK914_07965 [bacterium]|jgi:hypothetical protein|nr:hypothetical protein [bacterium]